MPDVLPPPPAPEKPLQRFWERLTEGREVAELWSQFKSDAQAGYRFYSREIDWQAVDTLPEKERRREAARSLLWAILKAFSPARRLLLLLGLVLIVIFQPAEVDFMLRSQHVHFQVPGLSILGVLMILALLGLEVADRVSMKRDLEIAREIQQWLVPAAPPEVAGAELAFATRPANTVAGDYHDVFPRPGDSGRRVLVTVADVAGKGVPAALLMATFQASLRTLSATPCSLPELLRGLNQYACAHSQGGRRFTTAVLVELDAAAHSLAYINAGHNAPVLRRRSGAVERLEVGGVPLGILEDASYPAGAASFVPGDLLLIFTDGLVEAVNHAGEEYGEERMLGLLAGTDGADATGVLRRLMADLDAFVGGAHQHDDITCLVLRAT
jgi:serine phosphatase RsbU (regulator of sigma subunit)